MDVIQEVGAYAGFAAVVGLAVLAALFFSQARDLRRLREWAGRAPERTAEQMGAQQAVPPAAPAPTGAVRPVPAAKPAPAIPSRAGAKPASAVQPAGKQGPAAPVPATAAASAASAVEAKRGEAKPDTEKPDAEKPGEGKQPATAPGAATPGKPAPATAAAAPGARPATAPGTQPPGPPGATPGAAPPPRPAAPAVPPPRTPSPAARPPGAPARPAPVGRTPSATSQSTAVLPASARVRNGGRPDRGRRGLEPRYIALIVAGVLVLGAGAAFGISQLGGEDDEPSTAEQAARQNEQAGPINRSLVTVSVLNGTTVPGLAAQIGDEIESKGFQRGNVANAIDQQRQDSVVMFSEGAERPARIVARSLGISAVEAVDPDSQALAGNASVVVVVGADQTQ